MERRVPMATLTGLDSRDGKYKMTYRRPKACGGLSIGRFSGDVSSLRDNNNGSKHGLITVQLNTNNIQFEFEI